MNWIRVLTWILVPLAGAVLAARGFKALKTATAGGARRIDRAVESGDLAAMVAAARVPAPPEHRHRLLSAILNRTYKNRKDPEHRDLFLRYARIHLDEVEPLLRRGEEPAPAVQTHKMLAIVLEENGEFAEGIAVCKRALDLGLDDGTKSGFPGRIERLEKRASR